MKDNLIYQYFASARELISNFHWLISKRIAHYNFGERYGISRGSSTEFLEHRNYFLGDDIRYIDWAASARSEQLVLKTYQEEIMPIIEIIFDCSESMAVTQEKWLRNLQFLYFLIHLSQCEHYKVKVYLFGENIRRIEEIDDNYEKILVNLQSKGQGLCSVLQKPLSLSNQSVRVIISDFMVGEEISSVLSSLLRNCSIGIGVRILDDFELNPKSGKGYRLTDIETKEQISIRLTQDIIDKYRGRFEIHSNRIANIFSQYNCHLITQNTKDLLQDILAEIAKHSGLIGF